LLQVCFAIATPTARLARVGRLLLFAWVLVLAGCNAPEDSLPSLLPTWSAQTEMAQETMDAMESTPTLEAGNPEVPEDEPTQLQEPLQATATLAALGPSPTPTNTTTPTATLLPVLPSATPTPLSTAGVPNAAIQFRSPGPMSRVVSPLQVRANVQPGPDGRVRLELMGEDGRLLVRKIINYGQTQGWVFVSDALDFEISAAAETARLVISTYDTHSRLYALRAVDVILLSMGEDDLNPPGGDQESVMIQEPLPNKLIQGSTLFVNGLTSLSPEVPLLIELVTTQGKVVGYRLAGISPDTEGGYLPFSAEIPYQVDAPTWARLTIRQESSGRIPGMVYATSLEVLLSP
jgi:hypothetical protein